MAAHDEMNAPEKRTEQARGQGEDPRRGNVHGFDLDDELRRDPTLLQRAERNNRQTTVGHPPPADSDFAAMEAHVRLKLARGERLNVREAEFFAKLHIDDQLPASEIREKGTKDNQ